ncbi:hypothetical protein, partial [Enterococcus faecium]|uniref:hypothetical protein n=1 Tax=Enterococcus faecium TaxID=1352 RepID=UPI003DA03DB5
VLISFSGPSRFINKNYKLLSKILIYLSLHPETIKFLLKEYLVSYEIVSKSLNYSIIFPYKSKIDI